MSALTEIAVHPVAQALTWALVHFIWQGAALGLLAFAILRFAPLSAQGRYAAGIVMLAAMLAAPIATTAWLLDGGGIVAPPLASVEGSAQHAGLVAAAPDAVIPSLDAIGASASAMPMGFTAFVLPLWLGGVLLLSVRLLGGWVVARRLARRAIKPVTADVQVIVRRIAAHLALDRIVRVFESTAVSVPVMMGWLRPVVLLPTAALGGLSPMQLEALIAHELAHVRRHDYVVNLLQSIVETLLFYHPAVWWVSKQVRAEREHCCDDLAVEVCDRVVYVSALAELAAIAGSRGVALAATDGTLVTRVRRLLGRSREGEGIRAGWLPAFVVVFAVGAWLPAGFVRADTRDDQTVTIAALPQPAVPVVAATEAVPVVTQVSPVVAVPIPVQGGVIGGIGGGVTGGVPVVAATTAVPVLAGIEGGIPVGVIEGVQAGVALSPEEIQELKQRLEQLRRARTEVELAAISKKLSIAATQDEVRKLKEQLVAVEKIQADQAKLVELTKMGELAKLSVDEALKSKLAAIELGEVETVAVEKKLREVSEAARRMREVEAQRGILGTATQGGSGTFSWSNNDDRVEMTWTGAFRLAADDRDIEWVEPGKSVRISDGYWLTATGVEIKGVESGVERTFFKKSFKLAYEPEGREFLATMIQKLIRRGFAGAERVKRLLAQGGVPGVLAEIDRLEGDHARSIYYQALMDQATLNARELADVVARAGRTISGDFELSATLARAATARAVDDTVRESILNATRSIGGDFEQRRALMAATYAPLSDRLALAGLTAARQLDGAFERSSYLAALAQAGGVTDATRQAYLDAANEIRAGFERDRALRAAGVPTESRFVRPTPPRAFEINREQPAITARPLTVRPRTERSAGTSEYLLDDLPREVEAAKTSADQRRVLEAAWAKGVSGMNTAAFLKTVASVRAESDRVALLLAVAKGAPLSGTARSAYVSAADTIKNEADQARVLAELVRNERRIR